jgi:hypothetical protein
VHLTNDLAFSNKQLETLQAGLLWFIVSITAGVLNSYTMIFLFLGIKNKVELVVQ